MYDQSPEVFDGMFAIGLWSWAVVTDQVEEFTTLRDKTRLETTSVDAVIAHYRLIAGELGFFNFEDDE